MVHLAPSTKIKFACGCSVVERPECLSGTELHGGKLVLALGSNIPVIRNEGPMGPYEFTTAIVTVLPCVCYLSAPASINTCN